MAMRTVSVRMDSNLYQEMCEIAECSGMSVNRMIERGARLVLEIEGPIHRAHAEALNKAYQERQAVSIHEVAS